MLELQLNDEPFSGLRNVGASTRVVGCGVLVGPGVAVVVGEGDAVALAVVAVAVGVAVGGATAAMIKTWPTRSRRASFTLNPFNANNSSTLMLN